MSEIFEELVYEYWDCDKCSKKELKGDIRICPSCGSPRNESIKFYRLEKKEELVVDTTQQEKFKAGADWLCSFCNTLNAIGDANCISCGATKDSSEKNYFDVQRLKEAKATKNIPVVEAVAFNWKKFSIWFTSIFTTCIGGICYLTSTHDVEFQVIDVYWKKTIPIHRYIQTEKLDWENELKGENIKQISSSKEIKSYEDRQVGTRTESYTDSESYQSGTKKECNTTYESTGSGASKKKTTCNNVPVYSNRNVTKTRVVPIYQKFPIYANKIKYNSSSYLFLRNFSLEGKDNFPKEPNVELGVGEDGKPDKKEATISELNVTFKKTNKDAKAIEIQKLKVLEENFKTKYILNSKISFPVNISDEISTVDGEELLKENK